ncbi:MAG: radical SAM protein [Dethiobacter sp.]|nr:radical SAM protein [Dethiobacter sp.]
MIENEVRPLQNERSEGSNFTDFAAPLFIAWQLNSACNIDCLHCCEEAGHSMPDELTREEIMDFCQQIVDLRVPYVAISGGEPLLHADFFKICEFFRNHGLSIKVETNGLLIDHKAAHRFAELDFRSVQVSVDGATPQTHEKLRVKGNWQKTTAACKYLVEAGVNTEIVFVPTKFNIHETGAVIEMAHEMGIYGFYTGKIMRIGRAAQNWEALCPSDEQYEKFFAILGEKQAKYAGKMKVYYYPYDVIEELKYRLDHPSASLLVIPNGKVKIIGPLPFICGDLRRQSLADIWQRYKSAWENQEVISFTKRVIKNPELLKEANKCREL